MKIYVAPLEGITGYIFRNAFNEYFGQGVDKYFTPFLTPCEKRAIGGRERNEVAPENNLGLKLVPQVMTVSAADFFNVKLWLRDLGYEEININLGCPSKTVTSKGRGSGALGDLDKLEHFLDDVFEDGDENISIKTRIGVNEVEEFDKIMDIYNKYPIKELTVHPRVMKEFYKGRPHVDVFLEKLSIAKMPVCYNGDINSLEDYERIISFAGESSMLSGVMIGRGILKNPALIRKIKGTEEFEVINKEVYAMLCKLKEDYSREFSGQTPVLYKLKEIWTYLGQGIYQDNDKLLKKLMKSKSISEYEVYMKQILR